jgi:soluble lytic murein transglycosylase-like protein
MIADGIPDERPVEHRFGRCGAVSLINGISGLGSGLGVFAGNAEQDLATQTRAPLLNSATPAAPAAATPDATPAGPAPATAAQAALATASGGSANVPVDYLPIYQAAAKRTGIPIDVLIAQGKQESNFDPNAVGSAGEIGLHQVKPSTAADPGYGLKGIDPATLKDPAVNINFAADYMRAKAGNPNFNDPASVDAALKAYNGGGDPNYVANVRSHMGAS